jgi:adenine/guanine phosphoribosyltransferase-like PRPP-binding protein
VVDLRAFLDSLVNPKITRERFDKLVGQTPKRVRFGRTHPNALKKAEKGPVGYFNVPFRETISEVFPFQLFSNKFGYSRTIKTQNEFDEIANWIDANRDVVFVRSLLSICIACCEHQTENGRSKIGELEYRAKWQSDGNAVRQLKTVLADTFRRLLSDAKIDSVAAIPSSTPGTQSLPCKLAEALSGEFGLENITDRLSWKGKKGTVKDKEAAEKWPILEAVGLNVDGDLKGRKILVVDDMYQSGATVHFVASKLQEAGAAEVHCLAVSKSRGDKDNV